MKKKFVAILLCAAMLSSMTGCGGKNVNNNSTESTEISSTTSSKRSGEFDIKPSELVKKLADYKAPEISLSSDKEITDESKNNMLVTFLNYYGADAFAETDDHDVVEAGDIVKVDYTGYLDGEAFDGGSAEGSYLDVSANKDAVRGNGFIEGFTDGLLGAKVGDTVSHDSVFPEDYGKEELNGKTTTFEFKIHAIVKPKTFKDLTDKEVAETFGEKTGFKTVSDLEKAIEEQLDSQLYSAKVDAVKSYLIENSEVEIPEDYLAARLDEYIASFEKDNCSDTESLEDYLSKNYNGMKLEDAKDIWKETLEKQIKTELIFGLIAEKEKYEIDEKEFDGYIKYIMNSGASSNNFEKEEDMYAYFGSGNADEGREYLNNQYLCNKAIDAVVSNSSVKFADAAEQK